MKKQRKEKHSMTRAFPGNKKVADAALEKETLQANIILIYGKPRNHLPSNSWCGMLKKKTVGVG
ncbi:hypothetical protein C5167_022324 [Papaver somniferum]|uniref:Uncharacterized protein n=1 Tax=Papaver somniferum TaxID=3469 RepID=A0A4Y7JIF5_PAPSO|nr:hypothetical protein C5167_022324 [Papaver somniferum]